MKKQGLDAIHGEKKQLEAHLARLLRRGDEVAPTIQRKELMQGDTNTKYYHASANRRRRRKATIASLQQEEGLIEGDHNMTIYITNFYQGLFGHPDVSNISLDLDNIETINDQEDYAFFTSPFTMEELKKAVFSMEHNKAMGSDGFPAEFY